MFIIVKHDEKNYIHNERYKSSVERKRMEKHYITKLRPTLNYLERYTAEKITGKTKKRRRSNKRKNKRKNSNRIADAVTAMDTITESREFTIFEVVKTKRRYTTLNSVINLYPKSKAFWYCFSIDENENFNVGKSFSRYKQLNCTLTNYKPLLIK